MRVFSCWLHNLTFKSQAQVSFKLSKSVFNTSKVHIYKHAHSSHDQRPLVKTFASGHVKTHNSETSLYRTGSLKSLLPCHCRSCLVLWHEHTINVASRANVNLSKRVWLRVEYHHINISIVVPIGRISQPNCSNIQRQSQSPSPR